MLLHDRGVGIGAGQRNCHTSMRWFLCTAVFGADDLQIGVPCCRRPDRFFPAPPARARAGICRQWPQHPDSAGRTSSLRTAAGRWESSCSRQAPEWPGPLAQTDRDWGITLLPCFDKTENLHSPDRTARCTAAARDHRSFAGCKKAPRVCLSGGVWGFKRKLTVLLGMIFC